MKNGVVVDQFNGVQSSAEVHKRIDDLIAANIEKPAAVTTA
jgi:thioredoxin-like negative regulator of GroEL